MSYEDEVADWPPLSDEKKKILADLLRPSNKGLRRIDQGDVDDVLDGVRRIGGAA